MTEKEIVTLKKWGVPSRFINEKAFSTISETQQTHLKTYVEFFPRKAHGLFLTDKAEDNNSFKIACWITKELLKLKRLKKRVYILQTPEISLFSNMSFEDTNLNFTKMQSDIDNADILIINDIGSQPLTASQQKTLYSFVHRCYREEKPLIVTSQTSLQETETFIGHSMAKIINDYCVFLSV